MRHRTAFSFLPLLALAALAVAGCQSKSSTKASWYTLDGQLADRATVKAAGARCREKVDVRTTSGRRRASLEWGLAMLDCMKAEGFVLLEAEPAPDAGS
jgi:hypothetical protein